MRTGTYFGSGASIDASTAFQESFKGVLSHEEVYYNPWLKVDKRAKVDAVLQKDLRSDTPVFAAGNLPVLIPVYVDKDIIDLTRKETPLVELIERRATPGKSYDYNKITALASAQWLAEGAALNDQTDTFQRATVQIKYGYSVGLVTGQAIAAMRGYKDAQAFDMGLKTLALRYLQENTIINGNATTNPLEYDGLITSITTNTTNLAGAAVTLTNIRDSINLAWYQGGMVKYAVTDGYTHNYIKGLLMDFQRFIGPQENLPFGIS